MQLVIPKSKLGSNESFNSEFLEYLVIRLEIELSNLFNQEYLTLTLESIKNLLPVKISASQLCNSFTNSLIILNDQYYYIIRFSRTKKVSNTQLRLYPVLKILEYGSFYNNSSGLIRRLFSSYYNNIDDVMDCYYLSSFISGD